MVIKRVKGGFQVFTRSGKPLSKHPLPLWKAQRQLAAVEMHKHRGQLADIGKIVLIVVCLIIYATLYPLVVTTISDMKLTGMEALIAGLIPFFILLGIALIPFHNNEPRQPPAYYG